MPHVGLGLGHSRVTARRRKDNIVSGPRGCCDAQINLALLAEVDGNKFGAHAQRSGTRQRLTARNTPLGDGGTFRAQNELRGLFTEGRQAGDGEIFKVDVLLTNLLSDRLLCFLHHVENERLALIRAVGADAKIELQLGGVGLVHGDDVEYRIWGAERDAGERHDRGAPLCCSWRAGGLERGCGLHASENTVRPPIFTVFGSGVPEFCEILIC